MGSAADKQGPFLVGSLIASSLGGVAACLAAMYFHRWPYGTDRKFLFCAVCLLSGVSLMSIAAAFWAAWAMTITSPTSVKLHGPGAVPTGFLTNVVLYGVCALVVQLIYAYRIWRASGGQRRLAVSVVFLAALSFICGEVSVLAAFATNHPTDAHAYQRLLALAYAGLVLGALADAVITLATYYYIRRANRNLAPAARLPALERFLRVTAETNALTFTLVMANLVLLAGPRTYWTAAVNEAIPATYTISLLASLLSRGNAKKDTGSEGVTEVRGGLNLADGLPVTARRLEPGPDGRRDSALTLVRAGSTGDKDVERAEDKVVVPVCSLTLPAGNPAPDGPPDSPVCSDDTHARRPSFCTIPL